MGWAKQGNGTIHFPMQLAKVCILKHISHHELMSVPAPRHLPHVLALLPAGHAPSGALPARVLVNRQARGQRVCGLAAVYNGVRPITVVL